MTRKAKPAITRLVYTFKSTNPAEASFVQSFFGEKGLESHIRQTVGLYGLSHYEVTVTTDVDESLIAELQTTLEALNKSDSSPLPPSTPQNPSLAELFGAFVVLLLIFIWVERIARQLSYGAINPLGRELLALLITSCALYFYAQIKFKNQLREIFALRAPISWTVVPLWIFASLALRGLALYATNAPHLPWNPGAHWLVPLLFLPVVRELMYRGFFLSALMRQLSPAWALVVVSLFYGLSFYPQSFAVQAVFVVTSLLLGSARLLTKSIYPPLLMHFAATLLSYAW